MSRWAPGAAQRLHDAAMALFVEQGFAATTVPQIAARAGLTTRSFFRWYADKREVLFVFEGELQHVVGRVFAEADPTLSPIGLMRFALLEVLAPRFDSARDEFVLQRGVVATDEGLRERALRKSAILIDEAVRGFRARGLTPVAADLAGRVSVALVDATVERWLDEPVRPFGEAAEEVLRALPDVLAVSAAAQ